MLAPADSSTNLKKGQRLTTLIHPHHQQQQGKTTTPYLDPIWFPVFRILNEIFFINLFLFLSTKGIMESQDPDTPTATATCDRSATSRDHHTTDDTAEEEPDPSSSNAASSSSSTLFQKLTLSELSGSCGDFGTLLPLLVALTRERKVFLTPTLLGTGIVHIVTGTYWDLPMPLQPMKSIAAIAIAGELTRTQVSTAGVCMGIFFLGPMASCGIIEFLHRWIPKSVIAGLQLGVGWKLAIKGIHWIQDLNWVSGGGDCILVSIVISLLCLYWLRPNQNQSQIATNKAPIGIYLFSLGMVMAIIEILNNRSHLHDNGDHDNNVPSSVTREPFIVNALQNATATDWKEGFLHGSLPQLPLTTLNSCLSVCLLAHTLFPESSYNKPRKVTRRSVCTSIGLMNLLLCPLGCMPNCHGAGGLAGQYRFGAQSGTSMVVLGIFKICLSLVARQGYLLMVLDALPISILGVMLVLAGHELAIKGVVEVAGGTDSCGGGGDQKEVHIKICLVTGLVIVGTGQTHVGALCGWITYMIYGPGYADLVSPILCCGHNDGSSGQSVDGAIYQPVNLQPQDPEGDI